MQLLNKNWISKIKLGILYTYAIMQSYKRNKDIWTTALFHFKTVSLCQFAFYLNSAKA